MVRLARLPVAIATAALVVAACGSSATPAPTSGPGASAAATGATGANGTPGSTGAPGGTGGPGGTGSAGGTGSDGFDFSSAATNLKQLDSYAFSVEIVSSNTTATGVKAGTNLFSGVVNNKDSSQTLSMITKDASGTITDQTDIVLLATGAWMRDGANANWEVVPAEQASLFAATFGAFRPEQLFSIYFLPAATNNSRVGDENRNGVATTHYRGGDGIGSILSTLTGVSSSWASDIWIAKDKGYLVHSEARAQGATASSAGGFSVVVDITNINGNNTVRAPI